MFAFCQVHRKGALYHLSESMTVLSAFTRVKGGCFLHVKMAKVHCCQGAPEIDGRRTSEHHVGVHVEKHVRELPAAIPEVASDDLTHGREGTPYKLNVTCAIASYHYCSLFCLLLLKVLPVCLVN
jgi:hypothetical protein